MEQISDEGTIGSIKIGLMGPFCGVGDPIFWGTLRPITAAIGASLALTGSALGPVLFFLAFNIVRMAALYFGLEFGYKKRIRLCKTFSRKHVTESHRRSFYPWTVRHGCTGI